MLIDKAKLVNLGYSRKRRQHAWVGTCTTQVSRTCLVCCELPALLFCEHFPPLDLRHRNPDIELRDLLLDISALLRSCELSSPPTSWKLTSNSLVYVML